MSQRSDAIGLVEKFFKALRDEEQWIAERLLTDANTWDSVLKARGELLAVRRLRDQLQKLCEKYVEDDGDE